MSTWRTPLLLLLAAMLAFEARASGGVHVTPLGVRFLSESEADGDAVAWGINANAGGKSWPLNVDFGWYAGGTVDLGLVDSFEVDEVDLGVRKTWIREGRRLRPHVAGGLSLVSAEIEIVRPGPNNNLHGKDSVTCGYASGGALWRLGKHFDIGLEARGIFGGAAEVDSTEFDVGYVQAGFFLGFGW